jgi:hypothetical protein
MELIIEYGSDKVTSKEEGIDWQHASNVPR